MPGAFIFCLHFVTLLFKIIIFVHIRFYGPGKEAGYGRYRGLAGAGGMVQGKAGKWAWTPFPMGL